MTRTSQTEVIPGKEHSMRKNSAGGVSFIVDKWGRLDRFLILGSDKGSYYASERELKLENTNVVRECIAADGARTVARIVEVSDKGRAPKNDPAIYALAMCLKLGDLETKRAAQAAVPKVCRIGTYIFMLAEAVKALKAGGFGRGTKRAFAAWYQTQTPDGLAMNVVKYQNRNGWTHKDLLLKAHVEASSPEHEAVARWVTCDGDLSARNVLRFKQGASKDAIRAARERFAQTGEVQLPMTRVTTYPAVSRNLVPKLIEGFEEMKRATTESEVIRLVRDFGLPRETVPTQFLNSKEVWDTLLRSGKGMPFTAMIRNLGKMSEVGLLVPMSEASNFVKQRLADAEGLKRARVHPLAILLALAVYKQGHGMRGGNTWPVDQKVVDALNDAFYLAFGSIVPTGKKHLLALDVSGSMAGGNVAGTPLTPRECSAAMALITARTEEYHHFFGFSGRFIPLDISPRMRLDDVIQKISGLPFETTDCSLPMIYAMGARIPVDAFVVYTDSETYAGRVQPVQALQQYRERMGIPAKLIVVGMVSNGFTIADPEDGGMMDVVGFDTAAPQLMADFIRE